MRVASAHRRVQLATIGLTVAALTGGLTAAPTARAQSGAPSVLGQVGAHGSQLDNLERAVSRLAREFVDPAAEFADRPLQRRLIDARVFFELGNFETAAILLIEVLENPAFRGNREVGPASLLLGKALIELQNYRGARDTLTRAVTATPTDAAVTDEARALLVEMALQMNDERELRRLIAEMGRPAAGASDRTLYALGKGLLRLGQHEAALTALGGVRADGERHPLARYYVGVALTALERFDQALGEFQALAQSAPTSDDGKHARELALVASGRLLMEQARIDEAITAYQRIDQNSASYEVALYEMAWAYIKREQYDKALQTLDVLLLVVKDEQLDVQAHVLRGRLGVIIEDYDQAVDSYGRILERFAPIRNELNHFARDPANVDRYFTWLIERRSKTGRLDAPLTDRTAAWVAGTEEMGRVVALLDNLGVERGEIEATQQIADDLERVVTSANRVELFPALKEGWTRALAIENQLIALSGAMLDQQQRLTTGLVSPAEATELASLVTYRKELEDRLGKLPMSYAQYQDRQSGVNERYLDLMRKSFLVEQTLKEVQRQLVAVEQYVNDQQFADGGGRLGDERERKLRVEIAGEKQRLKELYAELETLKKDIQAEADRVGTGDAVTRGEGDLKALLIAAHKREGNYYDGLGARLGGERSQAFAQYGRHRSRVWTNVDDLREIVGTIDRKVSDKTDELRRVIAAERRNLDGYSEDLVGYEGSSRRTAHALGEELFRRAHERMNEVVLEADVGLIDVAWSRKQEQTDQIRKINQERSDKLRILEEDAKRLLADTEETVGQTEATQ